MGETMLSWNITNWITVLLMVFLGFALFHFIAVGAKSMRGGGPTVGGMSNSPAGVRGN